MDTIVLELGGKSFKLVFGLKLLRLLGRKWELEDIDQVVNKIKTLESSTGKLTLDLLDLLETMLVTAIECGGQTINVYEIDVIGEFFKNPKALDVFKDALVNSMPNISDFDPEGK